ncbi:MAG: hypothetical protein AAF135_08240 [Bacteroidota bacterium]
MKLSNFLFIGIIVICITACQQPKDRFPDLLTGFSDAQRLRFTQGDTILRDWQTLAIVFPDQIGKFTAQEPTGTQISFGENQFATARRLYQQGDHTFAIQISDYALDSAALSFLFQSQSPWIQNDTLASFPFLLYTHTSTQAQEIQVVAHVRYHLDFTLASSPPYPTTTDILQALHWQNLDTGYTHP